MGTGDFRALTPEDTKLRGGSGRRITLGRQLEVATREGYTLSLGLLTNTQDEAFRGVQFAWLVNQARGRTGSQIGGLGNLALREVDGWQASVVGANWAMGPLQGGQVGLDQHCLASARLAGGANRPTSSAKFAVGNWLGLPISSARSRVVRSDY